MGDSPFITYEGGHYNRLALVLGQMALLIALFPRSQNGLLKRNSTEIADAALIGFLLTWVFFLKANLVVTDIFFISAGLVLFFSTGVRRAWSFYAALLISLLVCVSAVVIGFHLSLGDMFKDLKMASLARGNMVMNVNASQYLHGNTTFGLAGIYSDVINRLSDNLLDFAPLLPLVLGGLAWAAAHTSLKLNHVIMLFAFLGVLFVLT